MTGHIEPCSQTRIAKHPTEMVGVFAEDLLAGWAHSLVMVLPFDPVTVTPRNAILGVCTSIAIEHPQVRLHPVVILILHPSK